MAAAEKVQGYFEGLNQKLFDALPAARHILELGCANGRLGRAYKVKHPAAHWTGIDNFENAIAEAQRVLDVALLRDLDHDRLDDLSPDYDLIVFGDLIEHIKDPLRLLIDVRRLIRPGGRLVCCIPNMNHHSVIARFLLGDLSYDPNGLLDETHLRLYSSSSAVKLMLEAGWCPGQIDNYVVGGHRDLISELVRLSMRLGASAEAAGRNINTYQMIFEAIPVPAEDGPMPSCSLSVIVPVTSDLQYNLNIARSPGLKEIGAEILPIANASSAGHAFELGKSRAQGRWLLLSHQDMYFPSGSGHALARRLAEVSPDASRDALFGFVGLAEAENGEFMGTRGFRLAGQIVDRTDRIAHPGSTLVASIDECAVVLARDSNLSVDASFGWHLWATDLVRQARRLRNDAAEIVSIPVFHNSLTNHAVPDSFRPSLNRLLQKYPSEDQFVTLCGSWRRSLPN